MFVVRLIRESVEINVLGMSQEVKLSWSKGQVGAIPVFETKEQALEYAKGNEDLIYEIREEENEKNY